MLRILFLVLLALGILLFLLLLALLYLLLAHWQHWWPFRPERYPRAEFYIQDQVVVLGTLSVIENAINQVRGVRLERLERLAFSDLGEAIQTCEGLPENLVVDLYRIRGLFPNVERAIRLITEAASGQTDNLSAEPNWLAGDPWDPEGSPWDPEGSPWDPEGSILPGGQPKKPPQDAQPEWFMRQWAFKNIDLTDYYTNLTGAGIRVGVFDTSPFDLPLGGSALETVDWVQQPAPLDLQVSHPRAAATLKPSRKPWVDVRNHGLFISGLIHALAPACQIHLVRVLENDNRGDLYTLVREMFNFMRLTNTSADGKVGTLMNLSLGIRVPPEEANFKLPQEVLALYYLLEVASCLNIVVVSAAGNESSPAGALDPNLPARWNPKVIGVAASNDRNQRACFSNRGMITAPGGDGGQPDTSSDRGGDKACTPMNQACDSPDCGFGVIGPVRENPARTGFIFWSGSSFSTPLVSGLAALVLQAGNGSYTPARVAALLNCGATHVDDAALGAGVINVKRTLEECLLTVGKEGPKKKE
jgi:hypothetical protein